MNQVHVQYFKTSIGELILGSYNSKLCLLDFRFRKMRERVDRRIRRGLKATFSLQDDETLKKTRDQVEQYLQGKIREFDLPMLMVGTEFQKRVWRALMKVHYGETSSYLQLAKKVGDRNAVRAVAGANGANSIALIIPCHRIIRSDGQLTGYGGGLSVKRRLLKMEKNSAQEKGSEQRLLNDDEKYDMICRKDAGYNGFFFTAVRTTKIYCLPSCRARKPKKNNVVFYDKREDAEKNGYRACKVCRPELLIS